MSINYKNLTIVPPEEIPAKSESLPDNLIEIFKLCTAMEKICTDNDGVGLSAVQVGVPWNLFIMLKQNKYEYYLDCEYVGIGDKIDSVEGCLSLRNEKGKLRRFLVKRFPKVELKGKKLVVNKKGLDLEPISTIISNTLEATIVQHEIDHGFDILISDFGKEIELF